MSKPKPKPKWLAESRIVAAAGITVSGGQINYDPDTPAGRIYGKLLELQPQGGDPALWEQIEQLLNDLYWVVGQHENEYTGYAFWLGRHPLQKYIQNLIDQEDNA